LSRPFDKGYPHSRKTQYNILQKNTNTYKTEGQGKGSSTNKHIYFLQLQTGTNTFFMKKPVDKQKKQKKGNTINGKHKKRDQT